MLKLLLLISIFLISGNINAQTPNHSSTIEVNGKNIYYEVYGEGKPLFFFHGYSLSSKAWQPYVNDFVDEYQVYLVDLTGHGKSDEFMNDLSIRSVAQDIDVLIQYLALKKIQAIGFSFGGDVLYQLALINPTLIESMITIGAVGSWSVNEFPEYQKVFTFENRDNFPWLKDYHETDSRIRGIMNQFANYTVRITDEEYQSMSPEVMIMLGDDDEGMDISEVARVRKNLPHSDLWILPNVTHGAHEGETKSDFVLKSKSFLSKQNAPK